MTALLSYSTGTVSIGAAATTVVGVGTSWTASTVKPGDTLVVDGHEVLIEDVVDTTHLTIAAWPFTAVSAGTAYKVYWNSPQRLVGADAMADVSRIVSVLNSDGFYYFVLPGEEPDPSLGEDGQYARDPSTGEEWLKTGGVWVEYSPSIVYSAVQTFTNTTEATGVGTTYAAKFAGGVEILKKLFVAGAFGLSMYAASASGQTLDFQKSRHATYGSHTIVQNNDVLGTINFKGSDGTAFIPAAQIGVQVNGTPGTNDMPGLFYIATTADGASTPTNRITVEATGKTNILANIASTSTSTGSLTVAGGIGVGGSAYFGTEIVSPIVRSASAVEFQVNGTTFAGRVDAQRRWFFGLNATHNGAAGTIMQNANSASTIPSTGLGFNYLLVGADNAGCALTMQAFHTSISSPGAIQFFKARGTAVSPTATQNGDFMGQITAYGYRTSPSALYDVNGAAGIYMVATDNYTSTALGMQLRFLATPAGTATSQFSAAIGAGMTIGGTGNDPGTGCLRLLGTTASTGATSGTLICDGGVGIAGAVYIGGVLDLTLTASVTPATNGHLQIQATSNTSLTFKYKGSDGTVRSGSITLS